MKKRHFKKYIAPHASSDNQFRRDSNFQIFIQTGRGTLSVATFLLISFLVLSEIRYHMDSDLKFDYKVVMKSAIKLYTAIPLCQVEFIAQYSFG